MQEDAASQRLLSGARSGRSPVSHESSPDDIRQDKTGLSLSWRRSSKTRQALGKLGKLPL